VLVTPDSQHAQERVDGGDDVQLLDPPPGGHTVHDHDGQDLGLLLGEPRQPFGLDQLSDRLVKALVGCQLDMAAVVQDLHADRLQLLGQPARQARAYVGYLTQAFSLYQDLSVAENLRYVGELRRVPVREIERRGQRYLTMFGMERFMDRLAGRLSGGMKQKLALACALVAEPQILLLDEPTTGVDPVSRREFWDALAQLSTQGMTILLATPYLDEAERCHRVALMHDGRLHRTGTPAELRQSLGLQRLEVRATDLRQAEATLIGRDGIADVQRFGDRLVEGTVAGLVLDALVGCVAEGGAQAHDGVVVVCTVRWWHGRSYGLAPDRCRAE